MARNVTLAKLRERCRWRTDTMNEVSRFPDAELNDCINEGIAQYHSELVRLYGQGFDAATTFFMTSFGVELYALPASFLQLTKVWTTINGFERVLSVYEPVETEGLSSPVNWESVLNPCYRLVGTNISLRPTPATPIRININYLPASAILPSDGSTVDGIDGFEEFVIQWVVGLISQKQRDWELEQSAAGRGQAVLGRIKAIHSARNAAEPARMQDMKPVYSMYSRRYSRRLPPA